ncbi:flagellar hook-associated protein FlgK [Clostridium weizhouense]|uniref:Flagellar hook-associated protein 1 n=1 Tax=Clostridium weizhouense TaxID=2859781 RepID=A0ABS7AIW2_9CLOT|nr:flagellar hook-associated protein FlgK [Clostridium weizhouense]MBW6408590.1 flagellar hook-associated protein FlgK [Clostridium weizhouense]
MAGLFDTFTIAKRGLNVQQGAINTTSHNIANANTEGFSRQRAVSSTTRPFGGMSRFDTCTVGQVGTGAEISSIQRIRDSFIDYQVRNELGKSGNFEVQDKFLYQVESIFGEPSDSGIQQLLGEFFDSFQELSKTPEKSSARTVALQKASALANALNYTTTQLEKQVTDAQELLQMNIKDVNTLLDQINDLNKQIAGVCAVGQTPNDLMDSRDNLLDQLSSKFGITIDRKERETLDVKAEGFQSKNNPINNLVNSSPTDENYTRLSYVKSAEIKESSGNYTIELKYHTLGNLNSEPKTVTINCTNKEDAKTISDSLMQNRVLIADKNGDVTIRQKGAEITPPTDPKTYHYSQVTLNDGDTIKSDEIKTAIFKVYENDPDTNSVNDRQIKGEIAGNQGVQKNIKEYMVKLDQIASGLAYSVNAIQTGSSDGTNNNGYELVFTNGTNDDGITSKNITLNKNLLEDVSKLNCGSTSESGERAGERALAIASIRTLKMNMSSITDVKDRTSFFAEAGISFNGANNITLQGSKEGTSVAAYYKDVINTLGVQAEAASRNSINQDKILQDLKMQRLSVSGVSLDEEMTNLIQFQHAYSANAKIISTVDELLDVVINGLKR